VLLVLASFLAQPQPAPAANDPVAQACGIDREPWLCRWAADLTNSKTAGNVGELLSPWVSIVLIALGAWVANRLIRRLIRRGVAQWEQGGQFTWIRKRRMFALLEKTGSTPDLRRHQRAETIAGGFRSFASIIVWSVALVFMLAALGIDASTLLTSAGLIGVALGFGAQNLLRDLIAGTFMIFEDQVGVGDVIDAGLATGTVEAVTLRTTKLRDVEGVVWYVPNGGMNRVGNKTQQWSRAVIDIPVAYDADIGRAQQVIKQTAVEMSHDPAWRDRILSEPEVWGVESLALDSVTIRLVVKTAPLEQWSVGRELRARVKLALDAAGIKSPRPPAAPGPLPSEGPPGGAPG
jgi:small-conductance mechanosensitive channel